MERFGMEPLGTEEMPGANAAENGSFSNNPLVKLGSTGAPVTELQTNLKKLGYHTGAVSGIFDMSTYEAVGAFQTNNGLTVDGIAGAKTWAALDNVSSPMPEQMDGGLELNLGDTTPTATKTMDYTVAAGDTLWMLAQRFGTTVNEITILNGLTSDFISIGQVLRIPMDGGGEVESVVTMQEGFNNVSQMSNDVDIEEAPSHADEVNYSIPTDAMRTYEEDSSRANGFNYTVVYGDSLWKIAQRFDTTVAAIKADNNLTSDSLMIGQVFWISQDGGGGGGAGLTYTVVAGDTLWLIAQKFGTTVERIKELNGLTGNVIQIGQILRIS